MDGTYDVGSDLCEKDNGRVVRMACELDKRLISRVRSAFPLSALLIDEAVDIWAEVRSPYIEKQWPNE
jgi:hypothetical protein